MRADYGPNKVSLRLAFRPFVDAFQFNGRSTRTEVISFYLLGFLSQLVQFTAVALPLPALRVLGALWAIAWSWPWIPLLVRRLHDQNRTGHWAWLNAALLLLIVALWLWAPTGGSGYLSVDFGFFRSGREIGTSPFSIAATVAMIVIGITLFVLFLLHGTEGTNRYGPDPRLDAEPPLVRA